MAALEREVFIHLSRAQFGAATSGYILGLILLATFGGIRARSLDNGPTRQRWSLARINLLFFFVSSFLSVLSGLTCLVLLEHSRNESFCKAAAWICAELYGLTKGLVYFFLIEKVHIVWDSLYGRPRRRSPVYLFCLAIAALCAPVFLLIYPLKGYIYGARVQGGGCVNRSEDLATIPVLVFDSFITVLLTALFLWPLLKQRLVHAELRNLARRTFITSAVALSASVVNLAFMYAQSGREHMWVCMGSCNLDIMASVIAIFWSTRPLPRATTSNVEFTNHPPDLLPTFARPSKDTISTFVQHYIRQSVHRPEGLVDHTGDEETHYVIPLREGITPKKTSTVTLDSFGNPSV